jgi:uncharacterized protein YigA (DUF484 family)
MQRPAACTMRAAAPRFGQFPYRLSRPISMTSSLDSTAVAQFLTQHPNFFDDHADLLARIRLSTPLGGRTLSLQERQMEVLREKIKIMEMRLADLLRAGEENDAIAEKFQRWTRGLLLARNDVDLPHALISDLKENFGVPHATLRLWGVAEPFAHAWFAQEVSVDAQIFSNSLTAPFCGPNHDFEAASWLEDAPAVQSLALLPLRVGAAPEAFGLLVLGSADPGRFTADMATDFLARISETSSAALTCLLG